MKNGWYILAYHDISPKGMPYSCRRGYTCSPDLFETHIKHLNKFAKIVSIQKGIDFLIKTNSSKPLVSFWFDDGLASIRKYALPLLEKYKITAAFSACSRFWNKEEIFFRFKLSFLKKAGVIKILKGRLKKHGYKWWMPIDNFILDNFSDSVIKEMDEVFNEFAITPEKGYMLNLFETKDGLFELKRKGWVIANHTAAHYPITKKMNIFENQFIECEEKYKNLFKEKSKFWVLPFGRPSCPTHNLMQKFKRIAEGRYLVLTGNQINSYSNLQKNIIFRITTPACSGKELIKFIKIKLIKGRLGRVCQLTFKQFYDN